MTDYRDVLAFWLGPTDERGCSTAAHRERWFKKDPELDLAIVSQFGALHEEIARGEHTDWLALPPGRLAAILVLDQFSRNMFRGTPRAFAQDAQALAIALDGIELGMDTQVGHDGRGFYYLPLMHGEDLGIQNRCVEAYSTWASSLPDDLRKGVDYNLKYAIAHRDIIQRFGRFPHRNELLGRESTPEELAFLQQPGSSF